MKINNVLGLFDGISCGQVALQRAGIEYGDYYAFEIDEYARKVAEHNFPKTIRCGMVENLEFTDFKDVDLLLGGSPCTYWSIAKKDRETTIEGYGYLLFMWYVFALKKYQPKYFIYENNFSIHKNIKEAITKELGVEPIMINSSLVSAQSRRRLYWTNIPNVKQPQDKGIFLKDILESGVPFNDKSYCLTSHYNGAIVWNTLERKQRTMVAERIGHIGKGGQAQRIYSVKGKSVAITSNGGGQGAKTGLYKIDLPDGDYHIRKLTPIECERLQTLPDNYTGIMSKTQRYKQLGNGWTVDVIAHILRSIWN